MNRHDFLKGSAEIMASDWPDYQFLGAALGEKAMYATYLGREEPDKRTPATFIVHSAEKRGRVITVETVGFSAARHPSLDDPNGPRLLTVAGELVLARNGGPVALGGTALKPLTS
ncbi:MAG: hypothetical protein ACREGD_00430 [Candidatus Saccharimonadales bacterium]